MEGTYSTHEREDYLLNVSGWEKINKTESILVKITKEISRKMFK